MDFKVIKIIPSFIDLAKILAFFGEGVPKFLKNLGARLSFNNIFVFDPTTNVNFWWRCYITDF